MWGMSLPAGSIDNEGSSGRGVVYCTMERAGCHALALVCMSTRSSLFDWGQPGGYMRNFHPAAMSQADLKGITE
jgi:hypothetical protein